MISSRDLLANAERLAAQARQRLRYSAVSKEITRRHQRDSLEVIERSRKLLAMPVFDPFRLPQGGAGGR